MSKRNMPTKSQIKRHWESTLLEWGKFDSQQEYYEADYCFACGMIYSDEKNNTFRAHIVPRYKCEDDSIYNVVLLCGACHRLSEYIEDYGDKLNWIREFNFSQLNIKI